MFKKSLYLASAMAFSTLACERKKDCHFDDSAMEKEIRQKLHDARENTFFSIGDSTDHHEETAFSHPAFKTFIESHQGHIDVVWNNFTYYDDRGKRHKVDYEKPQ